MYLLALEYDNQGVTNIPRRHERNGKNDDMSERFVAIAHDLLREQQHRDFDKGHGITKNYLRRQHKFEDDWYAHWIGIPYMSSSAVFDVCECCHRNDSNCPYLILVLIYIVFE